MKSSPHLPELEKARTQRRRPKAAKNKLKKKNVLKKKVLRISQIIKSWVFSVFHVFPIFTFPYHILL